MLSAVLVILQSSHQPFNIGLLIYSRVYFVHNYLIRSPFTFHELYMSQRRTVHRLYDEANALVELRTFLNHIFLTDCQFHNLCI